MQKPVNSKSDSFKLAAAIVQSARYHETHYKFSRDHNYEMLYALLDAAGKVGSK